ncbi:MAG TPA: hypothetical protein VGT05_01960 [Patescibacteria group bacterium]|nr:hypothetical protein [Patescibacteria group bacterium]
MSKEDLLESRNLCEKYNSLKESFYKNMGETNRSYQVMLQERSTDNLPFVDDVLVHYAANEIRRAVRGTPFGESIVINLAYSTSLREREEILGRLRKKQGMGIAQRTTFYNQMIQDERGVEVPGTMILVAKKERRNY